MRANEQLEDDRRRSARDVKPAQCLYRLDRKNRWNLSPQRLPIIHFCNLRKFAPQLIEQLTDVAIVRVAQPRPIRNWPMSVMVTMRAAGVRVYVHVRRAIRISMLMGGRQLVQAVAQ